MSENVLLNDLFPVEKNVILLTAGMPFDAFSFCTSVFDELVWTWPRLTLNIFLPLPLMRILAQCNIAKSNFSEALLKFHVYLGG